MGGMPPIQLHNICIYVWCMTDPLLPKLVRTFPQLCVELISAGARKACFRQAWWHSYFSINIMVMWQKKHTWCGAHCNWWSPPAHITFDMSWQTCNCFWLPRLPGLSRLPRLTGPPRPPRIWRTRSPHPGPPNLNSMNSSRPLRIWRTRPPPPWSAEFDFPYCPILFNFTLCCGWGSGCCRIWFPIYIYIYIYIYIFPISHLFWTRRHVLLFSIAQQEDMSSSWARRNVFLLQDQTVQTIPWPLWSG